MTVSLRGRGRSTVNSSPILPGRGVSDDHAVGQEHGFRGRMRDEQHGLAPFHPDALQLHVHGLARHGVERAEAARPCSRMAGSWISARDDADALLHAARQLARIAVLEALAGRPA